jgi:hypothetical protein
MSCSMTRMQHEPGEMSPDEESMPFQAGILGHPDWRLGAVHAFGSAYDEKH